MIRIVHRYGLLTASACVVLVAILSCVLRSRVAWHGPSSDCPDFAIMRRGIRVESWFGPPPPEPNGKRPETEAAFAYFNLDDWGGEIRDEIRDATNTPPRSFEAYVNWIMTKTYFHAWRIDAPNPFPERTTSRFHRYGRVARIPEGISPARLPLMWDIDGVFPPNSGVENIPVREG